MMDSIPFRLLAIDLDGTLLSSSHQVSEENVTAIQQAQDIGWHVILVSARPPFGMQMVVDKIVLDGPLIAYNGAFMADSQSGEPFIDQTIPKADTNTAMGIIRNNDLYVGYYAGMDWYVEKVCEEMQWERRALKRDPHVTDVTDSSVPEPHKMIVADLNDSERLSNGYKNLIGILPDLNIQYSSRHAFEITHQKASKGLALEYVSKKLGINRESIVAMGDNFNDLEMFFYAGTSVAMGNAPKAVRDAADWVVASNDNHGVAEAIGRVLEERG